MILGVQITTRPDLVKQSNPIAYVSKATPPFFIAHGTNDHVVPFNQSEIFVEALKKAGARVTFHPVERADHVFQGITAAQKKSLENATEAFLQKVAPSSQ